MFTRIIRRQTIHRYLNKRPIWAVLVAFGCVLLLSALIFLPSGRATAADIDVYIVKNTTQAQSFQFKGRVFPKESRTLSSSSDGTLDKLLVKEGERVTKDQLLATIHSSKLDNEILEDKKAWLEAKQKAETFKAWKETKDVQTAKHQRIRAERELKRAKEAYLSAERLFALGIISQNEVNDLKTAQDDRLLELESAQKEYQLAEEKGTGPEKEMAELTLHLAEQKLQAAETKKAALSIKAPFDGWVLWPEQKADKEQKTSPKLFPQIGNVYKEDEAVMAICDATGFNVSFSIDEFQINKIKPGMPVKILVPQLQDMPFDGKVTEVSAKGEFDQGATAAQFKAIATVEHVMLKDYVFRTGLSSSITVENKNEGMAVPLNAIFEKDKKTFVMLKTKEGDKAQEVKLKETTPTQAVISEGLKEGDEIVISHPVK